MILVLSCSGTNMGFYIRKSFNVNRLLRINVSKSGLGISTGIPGLRVGLGPRGTYVNMGRYGVYYRASLTHATRGISRALLEGFRPRRQPETSIVPPPELHPGFVEIDSGPISHFPAAAVLQAQLDEAARAKSDVPPVLLGIGLMTVAILLLVPSPFRSLLLVLAAAVALPALLWARHRDVARRTVLLAYELDPDAARAYALLRMGFDELRRCDAIWHIDAVFAPGSESMAITRSANLQTIRHLVRVGCGLPPNVTCNVEVPTLPAGRQVLYFLPDQLLISEDGHFGSVSYAELEFIRATITLLEAGHPPADSDVVEYRWLYPKRDGTADARRRDNRQVPVIRVVELRLRSKSGLDEAYYISKSNLSNTLEEAVEDLTTLAAGRKSAESSMSGEPIKAALERLPMGDNTPQTSVEMAKATRDATPVAGAVDRTVHESTRDRAEGTGRNGSIVEAAAKSAARTVGSTIGRELVRGVLGTLLGGRKR